HGGPRPRLARLRGRGRRRDARAPPPLGGARTQRRLPAGELGGHPRWDDVLPKPRRVHPDPLLCARGGPRLKADAPAAGAPAGRMLAPSRGASYDPSTCPPPPPSSLPSRVLVSRRTPRRGEPWSARSAWGPSPPPRSPAP